MQGGNERLHARIGDPVPERRPTLSAEGDDLLLAQDRQVLGQSRLGHVDGLGQQTDMGFPNSRSLQRIIRQRSFATAFRIAATSAAFDSSSLMPSI